MKCQHCHEHEATLSFVVNWMGIEQEVHICESCAEKWRQYIIATQQHNAWNQMGGNAWLYMQKPEKARDLGSSPFLRATSSDLQKRRRLVSLKYQLEQAILAEQYEEAARIRDEIKKEETEVVTYE